MVPLHAPHPHEPVQPYWGLSGGIPPLLVHNTCGCPHPVATSPLLLSFNAKRPQPRAQAPNLCSWGPQQQTLEKSFFSLSSLPPLNFNVVVTECPCVPVCECAGRQCRSGGLARLEFCEGVRGPEQQDPCWALAPPPHPGARDCRVTSWGPALCLPSLFPPLIPFHYERKRKTTWLHLSSPPLWRGIVLVGAEN